MREKSFYKAQSQRQLRAGELIRRVLAGLFEKKAFHLPELENISITLTEVVLSPDLRQARVYCLPLFGEEQAESVLKYLNTSSGRIRKLLGKEIRMKFTPTLFFSFDFSFQAGEKIDRLLNQIQPERDSRIQLSEKETGESFTDMKELSEDSTLQIQKNSTLQIQGKI